MNIKFFILNDNNEPILCEDFSRWAMWNSRDENRTVGKSGIGDYLVSTVFLGFPHASLSGPMDHFFETMVFDKDGNSVPFDTDTEFQKASIALFGVDIFGNYKRYETWKDAEEGHNQICRLFESVMGLERVTVKSSFTKNKNFDQPT